RGAADRAQIEQIESLVDEARALADAENLFAAAEGERARLEHKQRELRSALQKLEAERDTRKTAIDASTLKRRSAAEAIERARHEAHVEALRAELAVGAPCPVCEQAIVA